MCTVDCYSPIVEKENTVSKDTPLTTKLPVRTNSRKKYSNHKTNKYSGSSGSSTKKPLAIVNKK